MSLLICIPFRDIAHTLKPVSHCPVTHRFIIAVLAERLNLVILEQRELSLWPECEGYTRTEGVVTMAGM